MAYKTPVVVELYYSGGWHDISALGDVATMPSITITRGRADETQQPAPGVCTLTLLNDDARYSPRNPASPLYGLIGRNTPIRVSVTGYGTRFVGEVESWPQVWDASGKLAVVPITAYGITRRLGAGGTNAPVKSPMLRYYKTVSPQPVAYWPLESGDKRGALRFPSALSDGDDLIVTQSTNFGVTRPFSAAGGVTPGPPGAASATDTSAGGYLIGGVRVVPGATTARIEMSMLANGFENTFPGILGLRNSLTSHFGSACNMDIVAQIISGSWYVGALWNGPSSSSSVYTATPVVLQDNAWHLLQLDQSSSGGGADTAFVIRLDGTVILSGTATGYTWNPPKQMLLNDLATDIDRVAHVAVWSGTTLPAAADSYDAFLAYPGETVAERLTRLGGEDGIVTTVVGTAGALLGPQPTATAMALRQDCIDVDGGVLVENRTDLGLTFNALDALYNRAAAVTLDYTAKEVAPPLQPVEDTRYIANDVTVTRNGGGSSTAVQETGPLNVQDPADDPQGVGRYPVEYTLNLYDDAQTAGQASWRLHASITDEPRYPSITANLTGLHEAGKTSLMSSLAAMDVADRVDVGNPPAWQGPDDISQIVQGYTDTIGSHLWILTANTSPFSVYRVGIWGNGTSLTDDTPRWDGSHSTTSGSFNTASLPASLTVATSSGNLWTTTGGHFPLKCVVSGVVLTVSAISGTSSPQTFTVTAASASKTIPSGSAVHIYRPVVYPLL